MPTIHPSLRGSDGYWLSISAWSDIFEPKKPVKKETPKTAAQIEKEKQQTLKTLSWVIDYASKAVWQAALEMIPQLEAQFMGDVCDASREEANKAKSEAADDKAKADEAIFCERVARFANAIGAMSATVRFETTATRARKPTCCNPCKPYCTKVPKPTHFQALREEAAIDLHAALKALLSDVIGMTAGASSALEAVERLSNQLAAMLDQVSDGDASSELDKMSSAIVKVTSGEATKTLLASLEGGIQKARRQAAAVPSSDSASAVTEEIEKALLSLVHAFTSGEPSEEAAKALAATVMTSIKMTIKQAILKQILATVAAALFGDASVAKAAVRAISLRQQLQAQGAAGTLTVDDLEAGAAEESAQLKEMAQAAGAAAKAFEEASATVGGELALMSPQQLKVQYEDEYEKIFGQLAQQKAEAVRELKEFLAANL